MDCLIPFPNFKLETTIQYVTALTKCIIKCEIKIEQLYQKISQTIKTELLNNQKNQNFKYELPTYNDLINTNRLDTSLYIEEFKYKEHIIKNYKFGFKLSRGQNLQISNIGISIYSKEKNKNFYTLILSKFLSIYGTAFKTEYLGNKNNLKTLKYGDLIFGAEGFEKGRSIVIIDNKDNVITNIHGITIQHEKNNIQQSIFIKLFLDYLRSEGLIDLYAVGGNGGSLSIKYLEIIPFPLFPESVINTITSYYHNHFLFDKQLLLDDYEINMENILNQCGILEIDKIKKNFTTQT